MAESISVDILAKVFGERELAKLGDQFAKTAVTADAAAVSLKVWNDVGVKSKKATDTLVASQLTSAKAWNTLAKAQQGVKGEFDKSIKALGGAGLALDDTTKKAEKAASGFSALAGAGGAAGGGMGALIAAGVVLSPVILTLGTGFAGLAAAAYGIAKPIENAAQKTGGLSKNLALLDPEQRKVAQGILGLGKQFGAFEKQLQPEVLGIFNQGLQIAGHLLRDIQPVTIATGKGFAAFLGQIDATFKSGAWQQFFGFMAKNAVPDMQLLGKTVADLLQVIPPLARDLQPLAHAFLVAGDDAAKAAQGVIAFYDSFQKNVPISTQHTINAARDLDRWVVSLTNHLGPWARAINNAGTQVQHATGDMANSLGKARGATLQVGTVTGDLIHPLGAAAAATGIFAHQTQLSAAAAAAEAHQLNLLAAGYEKALGPLNTYINANITEANNEHAVRVALRASGDTIGYKTQKERDSFSTVQTYIQSTIQQGNAALGAHKGIDQQIKSIQNALPLLESVKGKTAAYKGELDLLKNILDKLRAEKLISEQVRVTGSGTWHLANITTTGPQGQGVGRAAGGLISGGVPGRDSVPIMAMPGEVVVPTGMVRAGAVDHLRGRIPGFASGGVVPSYAGSPAGLPPWTQHNRDATITALTASIGSAMASAFKSATQAFTNRQFPGGGGGGSGEAIARAMFPWPAFMWPAFNYMEMREAGYQLRARNPSSGAYGVAQFINGPSEYYQYGGNPNTFQGQFTGMFNYIRQRYGNPVAAANHERAFNWYDNGGWLKPGLTLAYNGTNRPEMVLPNRGGAPARVVFEVTGGGNGQFEQFLAQMIRRYVRVRGGDIQTAFATSR